MQYSQRDLRAANILALTFLGLGLAFAGLGLGGLAASSSKTEIAVKADSAKLGDEDFAGASKKDPRLSAPVGLLLAGLIAGCLGTAVGLKVRQLQRTGGKEVDDYAGVPAP